MGLGLASSLTGFRPNLGQFSPASSAHTLALALPVRLSTRPVNPLALSLHLSLSPHPSCHPSAGCRVPLHPYGLATTLFFSPVSLPYGISSFSTFSIHTTSPKILNFSFLTYPRHLCRCHLLFPLDPLSSHERAPPTMPAPLTGCTEQPGAPLQQCRGCGKVPGKARHSEVLDSHLGASFRKQSKKKMTLRGHLAHFAARRQDQPDLKHSSETLAQPVFEMSKTRDSSPTAGKPGRAAFSTPESIF